MLLTRAKRSYVKRKVLLRKFSAAEGNGGRSVRGTWRRAHDSSLVWKSEPTAKKITERFPLCVCERASADMCKDALIRCGKKIPAGLWASNRSKKSTFLTSRQNRKIIFKEFIWGIFGFVFFFPPFPTTASLLQLRRTEEQKITQNTHFNHAGLLHHHSDTGWHAGWNKHTCACAQQVLTGWRPHSQNTDMQIGNLQTERWRWDEDRGT